MSQNPPKPSHECSCSFWTAAIKFHRNTCSNRHHATSAPPGLDDRVQSAHAGIVPLSPPCLLFLQSSQIFLMCLNPPTPPHSPPTYTLMYLLHWSRHYRGVDVAWCEARAPNAAEGMRMGGGLKAFPPPPRVLFVLVRRW